MGQAQLLFGGLEGQQSEDSCGPQKLWEAEEAWLGGLAGGSTGIQLPNWLTVSSTHWAGGWNTESGRAPDPTPDAPGPTGELGPTA